MWFKEYTFNILIQPFHLLLYTVLIGAAIHLAEVSLVYAIVAMYFVIPAEKLLRKFFHFDNAGTLSAAGSFAGGALFTAMINRINRPKPQDKDDEVGQKTRPLSANNRVTDSTEALRTTGPSQGPSGNGRWRWPVEMVGGGAGGGTGGR